MDVDMSGHSKWSTIKRDKAINDSKKGNLFAKISRLITVAAKQGGGDPDSNPSLRLALEKAHDARMPKENIERAVNKGVGKGEASEYTEVVYEGYGPSGVAFLVEAITDNRNRTVAELRTLFNKAGGTLGTSGTTAYIFVDKENPLFMVDISDKDLAETLVNFYEELEDHDDVQKVYTNFIISE